jgi:endonuclease/exonuclease/phosphatase family metal-dependent hydrolase
MKPTVAILLPLLLAAPLRAAPEPAPMNVMTFNIRYNEPRDGLDAWPNRKDMAASMIRFHEADLVGLQEALAGQIADLAERLPGFAWIGVGRDDGAQKGEYAAIFYRSERFQLLDSGHFWLSATPEIAGSLGWDASHVRIVTWGRFRDRRSGREFCHFNTHFDHRGERAREMSSRLVLERVTAIAKELPVVLTGDFNFPPSSPCYAILVQAGGAAPDRVRLRDTRTASRLTPHGPDWSWHGFTGLGEPGGIIDYIFVSDPVEVPRYGILSDNWSGRYPSDHLPVLAELVIR